MRSTLSPNFELFSERTSFMYRKVRLRSTSLLYFLEYLGWSQPHMNARTSRQEKEHSWFQWELRLHEICWFTFRVLIKLAQKNSKTNLKTHIITFKELPTHFSGKVPAKYFTKCHCLVFITFSIGNYNLLLH